MFGRLAMTAMKLNRPTPKRDSHPLARPDGGWYPGKPFDPTDILTDPKNWLVWRQFLIFFFSILCLPVATFLVVEYICRVYFTLHLNQSTTFGAIASMVALQGLMYMYVRLAALETEDEPAKQSSPPEAPQDGQSGTVSNEEHSPSEGTLRERRH